MGSKKQVLSSCSLLLAWNGANLFAGSRFLRIIRWMLRLCFLVGTLTLAMGIIGVLTESGLSLTFLAYASYSGSFVIGIACLIIRRGRIETLFISLISNLSTRDVEKLLRYIGLVNLSILMFTLFEYSISRFTHILQLSRNSNIDHNDSLPTIAWSLMMIITNWVPNTAGFYIIGNRILFLYHKKLMAETVRTLDGGYADIGSISRTAKLIRDSSREFDHLFSILPFLWFLYGIIGAPKAIIEAVKPQGAEQILSCMFLLRNIVAPILAAYRTSVTRSSINDMVDHAQDLVMMRHTKGCCDDILVVRELDSIKSIRLTGLSFFGIDKSFIISYIGTVLTFAALISTYMNNG
jgi:hypothetical protein